MLLELLPEDILVDIVCFLDKNTIKSFYLILNKTLNKFFNNYFYWKEYYFQMILKKDYINTFSKQFCKKSVLTNNKICRFCDKSLQFYHYMVLCRCILDLDGTPINYRYHKKCVKPLTIWNNQLGTVICLICKSKACFFKIS